MFKKLKEKFRKLFKRPDKSQQIIEQPAVPIPADDAERVITYREDGSIASVKKGTHVKQF